MNQFFEWIVVGAGPAGIASIGKLLDAGVTAMDIAWIDPQFKMGDFGTTWRYVSSNTPIESFVKFYQDCQAFRYQTDRPAFMIDKIDVNKNCPLMLAAQPLQWITQHLSESVNTFKDKVTHLAPNKNMWQLQLASGATLNGKKIILTIGAEAKELHFANLTATVVPLTTALNPTLLRQAVQPNDCVAVFGAAQSAKTTVENLAKIETQKNILFYRSEYTLARHFRDTELNNIESLAMTPQNLLAQMPQCNKVIYAIGFERRHIPITGLPANYSYDKKNGEIAPGLFGLGIGFPEIMPYELGKIEYPVSAIWPFMKRLKKLMPSWLA